MEDAKLTRALFEIYLGANPVAPSAKASFGAKLAAAPAKK